MDRLKVNWLLRGLWASDDGAEQFWEQHAFYCTFHSRDLRSCEELFQVFKNTRVCDTHTRIQPIPDSHRLLHQRSLTTRRSSVYPKPAEGTPAPRGTTEANALCCEGTVAGGAPAQPHLW